MAETLYTKDNADGTGAVIKLNSTAEASAITIQRATVTASGIGAYSDVTPVGAVINTNYTIAGTGYYSWRAALFPVDPSTWVYGFQPATEDGDSPWMRAITATKDRIEALDLDFTVWLKGGVTFLFDPKLDENGSPVTFTQPCVLLTITGETESIEHKTNQQEDISYPVVISIIEKKHTDKEDHRARLLRARWLIERGMNSQQWDYRVPECYEVEIRPSEVLVPTWMSESAVRWSLMTAWWKCREIRRPPGTGG